MPSSHVQTPLAPHVNPGGESSGSGKRKAEEQPEGEEARLEMIEEDTVKKWVCEIEDHVKESHPECPHISSSSRIETSRFTWFYTLWSQEVQSSLMRHNCVLFFIKFLTRAKIANLHLVISI